MTTEDIFPGLRVKYLNRNSIRIPFGTTGTVLALDDIPRVVRVCWDIPVSDGHDCGGMCQAPFGWNVFAGLLEPCGGADDDPTDISSDSVLEILMGG